MDPEQVKKLVPVIGGLVVVGGGAIYLATKKKPVVAAAKPAVAAAPAAAAPAMSPQLTTAFNALLAQGQSPTAMQAAAAAMQQFGLLNQATALNAQAAVLQQKQATGQAPPAPAVNPTQVAQAQSALQQAAAAAQQIAAQAGVQFPAQAQQPAAAPATPAVAIDPVTGFPLVQPGQSLSQQLGGATQAVGVTLPTFAKVTTNDPAPSGDLIIRDSAGGNQIGAADKDGIVTVTNQNAGSAGGVNWSQVVWTGGRNPAATGFVKSQFLQPSSVGPLGTAIAGEGIDPTIAIEVAPSGARLRVAPSVTAQFRAFVGHGERVKVIKTIAGNKMEAHSPGRKGGWALVQYKGMQGFLPREWLVIAGS